MVKYFKDRRGNFTLVDSIWRIIRRNDVFFKKCHVDLGSGKQIEIKMDYEKNFNQLQLLSFYLRAKLQPVLFLNPIVLILELFPFFLQFKIPFLVKIHAHQNSMTCLLSWGQCFLHVGIFVLWLIHL